MDSNEPIVEIAVDDMTKVPAMPYKDFSAFFNPFVSHTVKFLNRFACVCEEKLADLALRIQRLEITISLLETKLSSIPALEDVKIETPVDSQPQQTQPVSNADIPSATPSANVQEESQQEEPEPAKPARKTVAQDPSYAKYFKMIKMGVPLGALRSKMANDGLNPDLLECPDAPLPDGDDDDDERSVSEGSSASSFSDED